MFSYLHQWYACYVITPEVQNLPIILEVKQQGFVEFVWYVWKKLVLCEFLLFVFIQACSDSPADISDLRCKENTMKQIVELKALATQTVKKKTRTKYGIKETDNKLLELSIDLHK